DGPAAPATVEPTERVWWKHYGPGVPTHVEIPNVLLTELVEAAVGRWPDRKALIYYGASWTYRAFWTLSERLAGQLARDGVGPGDRVGIYLPNGPLYPIALFAVLRLGATVVQISPLYLGLDLEQILRDAQPKAVITLEILYPNLRKVRADGPPSTVVVARLSDFYPVPKRWFVNRVLRRQHLPTDFPTDPGVRAWARIALTPARVPLWKGDPATTVAVLQYTGGTTGRPKGAMLTHRNLVANVIQDNTWNTTRRSGEEVILAAIPFFHIYGLTVAGLMGLADGATLVIQTRPEVRELLRLITRYRPTQFPGVP
ncbi:long-chain-fatty-acid--CoA ligase, partial [mine drainage metagenome]